VDLWEILIAALEREIERERERKRDGGRENCCLGISGHDFL